MPGIGLGAVGLAAFLLATGALAPVVSALTPSPAAPAPVEQVEPVAAWTSDTWLDHDPRPEWSGGRTADGPSASRPSSPSVPSRPSIGVPENPKRFLRGGVPPNNVELRLAPRPSCFQQRSMAAPVRSFAVTPRRQGVAVSWWDIGDPDTTSYQLTAVPTGLRGGVTVSKPVAAPGACRTVRTTMSGLVSGQTYRFWLTALNVSPVNGRQYRPTRGQSNSVVVL